MTKTIRYIGAAIILLGILLLAGNQIATAGGLPWQNSTAIQSQNASAMSASNQHKGTVTSPPIELPLITVPGNYSLGGVCTLLVAQLQPNITLHAILLPFNTLAKKPTNITRYLAGDCSLKYQLSGKLLAVLTNNEGSVQICFAQIPNIIGQIYVLDGRTWAALITTPTSGMECATADETGDYVLVPQP